MTREPNDKDPKDPKPSDEVEAELEGPPRRDPTVEIEHAARASASAADVAPTDLQPTLTLPLWQRIVAMVAPAALGIPLVLSKTYALHVVGLGLALLAGYALVREVSTGLRAAGPVWSIRGRDIKWLPSALPAFVVFAVAAGLLWPTFIGQMPQSQDHPVHLTRAWHFVTQQLSHGQLSGWSDLWFAGWPAGEDYPPGGDYWISAVYLVTFGLLGWEAAYAVAFLGVLAACGLACYHFGRTYFGRTAGMLAGLFFLLDRGYYREGGWNYTVWWGVWPQILSTAFTILSFSTLDRVLRRGRPRDFAVCALCTGFAILSHPVAIIYFGIGVPVYLAARALGTDERASRMVVRALGALGLGAAIAAFWVLPFSAKGAWMAKYGELWKSLPAMGRELLTGTLFGNIAPPLVMLGVLGGALAAWRRSFAGVFAAGFGLIVLFLSSSTAFQKLELLSISPAFGQVQFQRLSIPAKVCVFLLAAYALQELFRRLGAPAPQADGAAAAQDPDAKLELAPQAPLSWKRYALVGLLLLAVAPFVEPTFAAWGKTYGAEIGRPKTRRTMPLWNDYQRFLAWSKKLPDKKTFRIAYVRPYNDHFFAAAPVYNKIGAYKVGFTPCTNFIYKPDIADPELYKLINVKYVVSIGRLGHSYLERVRSFGRIVVHRFKGYSTAHATMLGQGTVKVSAWERDRVKLEVSGAGPKSRVVLHRAMFPNWKASYKGDKLPVELAALGRHRIFMSVPAKNGTIDIRYGMPAVNVAGALVSWLAIALLVVMALSRLRPKLVAPIVERARPWGPRLEKHGLLVAAGVVVLGAVFVLLKGAGGGASKDPQLERGSLLNRLDKAEVTLIRGASRKQCPKKRDRFQCSEHSWNYVGKVTHKIDAQFRKCLWAHPVQNARLEVRFKQLELGRKLTGHHGLLDDAVRGFPGGAPVRLEVVISGGPRQVLTAHNRRGWSAFALDTSKLAGKRADVTFTISTTRAGGRHYCFAAEIAK